MKSLSSVGLGLSIIFGCLLLALVCELYYLLWWKKRFTNRDIENDFSSNNPANHLLCMFCCKKSSAKANVDEPPEIPQQQQSTTTKDQFIFKPFDDNEAMESELMRLHNLSGPPRFLFTIMEETKEDLESEEGKSKRLSDFLVTMESGSCQTPYLTPLASPSFFTSPQNINGFNPLFESTSDAEFNSIRSSSSSSPPPKFKFLQDAEEKLYKKRLKESTFQGFGQEIENKDSFFTIIVDR
ncbi:hypothetical protein ACFE04_002827 [Oxalis oulophora]